MLLLEGCEWNGASRVRWNECDIERAPGHQGYRPTTVEMSRQGPPVHFQKFPIAMHKMAG
jgi:hypothetical protein